MAPECGSGVGGCSRPGCAGARLVHGDGALLAEAELLQQHQQQQASQKPYRIGLILLCVGALFNWLGLAQAYVEPMRYIGVGCIVAGALLICAAMCRWLGRSGAAAAAAIRPDELRHNVSNTLLSEVSVLGDGWDTLSVFPGSEGGRKGEPISFLVYRRSRNALDRARYCPSPTPLAMNNILFLFF